MTETVKPYKVEVTVSDGSPPDEWYGNALRFATPEEAVTYSSDLFGRWLATTGRRVVDERDGSVVFCRPRSGGADVEVG